MICNLVSYFIFKLVLTNHCAKYNGKPTLSINMNYFAKSFLHG